jgi:hypothetical protein
MSKKMNFVQIRSQLLNIIQSKKNTSTTNSTQRATNDKGITSPQIFNNSNLSRSKKKMESLDTSCG